MATIFIAFPADPPTIPQLYQAALDTARSGRPGDRLVPWTELLIDGRLIPSSVLSAINSADLLVADITVPNLNVVYEIGYAIGVQKPIRLLLNRSISSNDLRRSKLNMFETIGLSHYDNSESLCSRLHNNLPIPSNLLATSTIDRSQPVYVLKAVETTPLVSHLHAKITTNIKFFRSFDPVEQARLSANVAISEVSSSIAVIVSLIPLNIPDADIHNFRSAFVAGLARGLGKELLIIHLSDHAAPLDFRDEAIDCATTIQLDMAIDRFSIRLLPILQQQLSEQYVSGHTLLERLTIGSSVAENEMQSLSEYYLPTEASNRVERGEARVVVGRKGSGKTALSAYLQDRKARDRGNVVVDLRPEGYKLLKFRTDVLSILEAGTLDHIVTAIWEYVLLLEIAYTLLQEDAKRHLNDHDIFSVYVKLKETYFQDEYHSEGDFSERFFRLLNEIASRIEERTGDISEVKFTNPEVAQIVYRHPIAELRQCILEYVRHKKSIWILIDNLDKGWPSAGLARTDIALVRCLVDASEKIKKYVSASDAVPCVPVVFLRTDVFDALVRNTADRGKIAFVSMDLTDSGVLKEILRRRFVHRDINASRSFDEIWSLLAADRVGSQSSFAFLLNRSLMRPRVLLDLVSASKAHAVNRRHQIIEEEDMWDGAKAVSMDLVENISVEIRDVAPDIENAIYLLIDRRPLVGRKEMYEIFKSAGMSKEAGTRLVELFLWYGVFGVQVDDDEVRYIYDLNYNALMMAKIAEMRGVFVRYCINPAFRSALAVADPSSSAEPRLI